MQIKDYPRNGEIRKLRQVILDLEKTKDWDAIVYAKNDLKYEIAKREAWIKKNVSD